MYELLKGKTLASLTLGCKVNMYDTQAMVEILVNHGCRIVEFEEKADIYLINTCTVTNFGDKKSRQILRKAHRLNPNAVIVACGCYSQVEPEKVAAIEGISIILGTQDRIRIGEFICQYLEGRKSADFVSNISSQREFEDLSINTQRDKTRAYLKIQEGCDRFCTYCIIPFARGPVRSRQPENVIAEAARLSENGFKEIVLTGIHVASYGKDIKNTNLCDILKQISKIDKIQRIRFSSIEPNVVNDEFLDTISSLPKICDHFHLSLQSGCDKTLQAMNRHYTAFEYLKSVNRLRSIMPQAGITTDIIVGFPGESDEDFHESLEFVKKAQLSRIHVFPYSAKTGTKAAVMLNQVPPKIKEERAKIMGEAGEKLTQTFAEKHIGKDLSVLFEKKIGDKTYEGHSTNYITVRQNSPFSLENELTVLRATHCENGILYTS